MLNSLCFIMRYIRAMLMFSLCMSADCSFMKLRLDRVLKMDLGKMDIDTATKSTAPVPELKPKEAWIAPYSQYAPGWWEVFMRN